jgi:hypothetical protein
MACISRYANKDFAQRFGDGRHRFYFEFRCNRPCLEFSKHCKFCQNRQPDATHQFFLCFDHGNINQPLPDNSHIYGSKWYFEAAKRYGEPPSEIIEFALQYQKEARKDFIIENSIESSKDEKQSIPQEMPRPKKIIDESVIPVKRSKKPAIAITEVTNTTNTTDTTEDIPKPVKRTKKPKVATEVITEIIPEVIKPTPKKRAPRKKPAETPYNTATNTNTINDLSHKEVSLPTHIEKKLEEIDSEGYDIEYIQLSLFEANGTTYFRDSKKNKLYKKIKDRGIGAYIGRWNPDTESIISTIPDSDNEE